MPGLIPRAMVAQALGKALDLDTDVMKYGLLTALPSNKNASNAKSSFITAEATGTGYTAGGATLTTLTISTATNDQVAFWSDNPSWGPTASISGIVGGFLWDDTVSTPVADPVVCTHEFGGGTYTVAGGTFNVSFAAAASGGLFYATV